MYHILGDNQHFWEIVVLLRDYQVLKKPADSAGSCFSYYLLATGSVGIIHIDLFDIYAEGFCNPLSISRIG